MQILNWNNSKMYYEAYNIPVDKTEKQFEIKWAVLAAKYFWIKETKMNYKLLHKWFI